MDAFAVTVAGFEDISADEVRELASSASKVQRGQVPGIITFSVKDVSDFCSLAYRTQSLARLCVLLATFRVAADLPSTLQALEKQLAGFALDDWIDPAVDPFLVECERSGTHEFTSLAFATAVNALLTKTGGKLEFKAPRLRFFCFIAAEVGYFGIDLAGFDLSKREYRIFGHSTDLKAPAAFGLVKFAGYNPPKEVLLDPFTRSGAIAIEATLFNCGFPVNYYKKDVFSFLKLKPFSGVAAGKLFAKIDGCIREGKQPIFSYSSSIGHVRSCEKNAKIAGINKSMQFGRVDTEWLELKFDKGTVDCIVSYPPALSKERPQLRKLYTEFFYQADFILSRKGRVALAVSDVQAVAEVALQYKFVVAKSAIFFMGEAQQAALLLVRK